MIDSSFPLQLYNSSNDREKEDRNFNVKYFEREVIFSIINLECEVAFKVSNVFLSLLKERIEEG